MRLLWLLPLLLLQAAAPATEGGDLKPLREAMAAVRAGQGVNKDRDAGPELAPVKQALRAWVEARLPEPGPAPPDYPALGRRLAAELDGAGLTCGPTASPSVRCASDPLDHDSNRGSLGPLRIGSLDGGRYLVLVTAVGVRCGYDESAYVYEHRDKAGWRLILAVEESDYREKVYNPRNFLSIDVSPAAVAWNEPAAPPLVAALTFGPWCSSNWHALVTRLWRVSPATATPRPLLDRDDSLFMGDDFIAAERLTRDDLLVEFRGDSADGGVLVRPHVLHYRIAAGDRVQRIGPVALAPRDFVDEWMRSGWDEARAWTDGKARAALGALRARLGDRPYGEFDPERRCRSDPTLWQIGFTPEREGRALPPVYFRIRWMPPYRFTLMGAGSRPLAGCDRVEPRPDEPGTLFPLQGWRGE